MDNNLLNDFPTGPLDKYRKLSSFDWKKLKIYLDTKETLEFQNELLHELKKNPIFYPITQPITLDERRHLAVERMMAFREIESLASPPTPATILPIIRTIYLLDNSASIKFAVTRNMVVSGIRGLGTDMHNQYIEDLLEGKIIGCFCLTEIGHGSNAKFMRTTATFNKDSQEFILNTPDFEAAKCWAGVLGQTATHALVYAQLISSNGVQQGLHAFFVNIRDPKTLLPRPGVIVGDMGEKIGLNGVDNGFLMFNNYHIPKSDLLNRTGDISEEGKYMTPFTDPNKRHGVSMGTLSGGRVFITDLCGVYVSAAVTIALRYAAVRKQFGPDGQDEISIIEYQTHQHRLLPYLAVGYVLKIFGRYLMESYFQFIIESLTSNNKDSLSELGIEIHGISAASKSVSGWIARDGIQECREACGGHGYLKAAGIGDLRNDNDANCTYEGENHILIQQTSNWLLKFWPKILNREKIATPLQSVNFLTDALRILKTRFSLSDLNDKEAPNHVINAFRWLVCYLLKISHEKVKNNQANGLDSFTAKNEAQVFYSRNLAVAYVQHFFLQRMLVAIEETKEPEIKNVLTKLFLLYGVWTLEKHLPTLYQGRYANGSQPSFFLQDSILNLCRSLKNDAIALVDAISPPDFVLNSVLGKSDGLVYQHLQNSMMTGNSLSRPEWWKDIIYPNLRSKF